MGQEISLPVAPMQLRDVFTVRLNAERIKQVPPADDLSPTAHIDGPNILGDEYNPQVEISAKVWFESDVGPFKIEVTVVGVFAQVGDLPEGFTLSEYLGRTSLSLLLPFLREQVYDLSIRLRVGPVLIPTINPQAMQVSQPGTPPQGPDQQPLSDDLASPDTTRRPRRRHAAPDSHSSDQDS